MSFPDDEWNLCERWVVAETKGYLRASTTVTAWATSEAGRKRWRAWTGVLERRTYASAVWAMASDSLFRSSTAPTTGAAGPFSARRSLSVGDAGGKPLGVVAAKPRHLLHALPCRPVRELEGAFRGHIVHMLQD